MGIGDLRRKTMTAPAAKAERAPAVDLTPQHVPLISFADERRELAQSRGPKPDDRAPYSAFLQWAAPGRIPFPDEEEIAIRAWAGIDEDEAPGLTMR